MIIDTKFKVLLNLGEVTRSDDWPNYLSHGFSCDDVQALLDIVSSDELNNAHTKSNEVWAPLHAWRALGQLACAEAAAPLIDLFDRFCDDDWALTEIPKVLGMIGEPAIESLSHYLNQPGPDEFARAMAADGLKEIALRHPQLRESVVNVLTNYLNAPDSNELVLNACVVSSLIDLSATESIEIIRNIYANGLAELAHCGDIEEVEISLGLRSQRSTPEPNYYKDFPLEQAFQPSNDEPTSIIDFYLSKYGTDDSILDVSELDGFIAAVVCAPTLIKPSTWMPAIWGGEEQSPEWMNMEEVRKFSSSVMMHYNETIDLFRGSQFSALFLEHMIEKKSFKIVDEWCEGFIRGLQLWPRLNDEDYDFLEEHLYAIWLFASDEGLDELKGMSESEIEAIQQRIEPTAQVIYDHFAATGQTFRHTSPKVGRNDPCPCGSGKKFKKCCLH